MWYNKTIEDVESEELALVDDYYIIVREKIRGRDVDLAFDLI